MQTVYDRIITLIIGSSHYYCPYSSYLEDCCWPCAGELSVVNAVGTKLRDRIKSGPTRRRHNRWTLSRKALSKKERSPRASTIIIQPIRLALLTFNQSGSARVWGMSRLAREGTAEPVSRDQMLRRAQGQGKKSSIILLLYTRFS